MYKPSGAVTIVPMYIETVPNRNSPPAILLQGWARGRQGQEAHHRQPLQVARRQDRSPAATAQGRTPRRGDDAFDIVRSLPHGHVAAVLGTLRQLRLERLVAPQRSPERDRVVAMIVARVLEPGSKLATAGGLAAATARHTLADALELDAPTEDDLYAAMDWLLRRQDRIERTLARRHLEDGALVLYDLTSVYLEGRKCPLAKRGYSRDGRKGKLQIEFGLLCDADGRPVAVRVFPGNTADPATVGAQVDQLRERFGLSRVVLVGDRGMLTEARIREDVKPAGLDWIGALRGPAIRKLVASGAIQLSLFDERDLVEVRADAHPANASSCAAIRCSPRSARASARICLRPPRSCSVGDSVDGRRRPHHPTTAASATAGTPPPSPPRRPSTGCTSSAPACRRNVSTPTAPCAPTSA